MKIITIYEEGISPLTVTDNDERKITEYARELSPLMSLNDIMLFHTSNDSVLVRPQKIHAIHIIENDTKSNSNDSEKEKAVEETKKEEHIDILTDM